MPRLSSSTPVFADLFYGVVAGSAITSLHADAPISTLLLQTLWLIAVLEDWFVYHRFVRDDEGSKVPFEFYSLLFEFVILTLWYLGYDALSKYTANHSTPYKSFFFLAALFYLVKLTAGIPFYLRHSPSRYREILNDCVWLIPVIAGITFGVLDFSNPETLWVIVLYTIIIVIALLIWWFVRVQYIEAQ